MSWNHRVWLHRFGDETWYDIRETYYNDGGKVCANDAEATAPLGETLEELRGCILKMLRACELAIADSGVVHVEDGFQYAKGEYEHP